jgi:hypothetical protein
MSYYDTAEQLRIAVSALLPPEEYVALLTSKAEITRAQDAFAAFARENGLETGPYQVGWNTLQVCGDHGNEPNDQGVDGENREIDLEYPLQPGQWFRLRIAPWAEKSRRSLTILTSVDAKPCSLPERLLQASLCYQ